MKKEGKVGKWIGINSMIFLAVLGLSFIHINVGKGKDQVSNEYPANMNEALGRLDDSISDDAKEKILHYERNSSHNLNSNEYWESIQYSKGGIAMSLRNNLGLWDDSKLKRWFMWRGISHPDSMSSVIFDEYLSHLKEQRTNSLYIHRFSVLFIFSGIITFILFIIAKLRILLSNTCETLN